MSENIVRKTVNPFDFRANLPKIVGGIALVGLVASLIWIGISFTRQEKKFVIKGEEVQLSKDIVGVVNGYERRETDGEITKYFIKADKATTFSDKHQELENVYIEVYDEVGDKFDKITANKAIYVPNANDSKLFNASFNGDVNIETRDSLKVKTEKISYDRETEIAETEEPIQFSRENMSGKAKGAIVKVREKRLELLNNVELAITEENDIKNATITAGKAILEQNTEIATFEQNVNVAITPKNDPPTDAHAEKIVAHFTNKKISKLELTDNVEVTQKPSKVRAKFATAFFENDLKRVDLRENVEIENVESGKVTNIRGGTANAFFDKELKRVDLNENVQIENSENGKVTNARGGMATAFFDKGFQRAELSQNVEIDSQSPNESPTKIRSQIAIYDKVADKFDLKKGVEIITSQDNKPTVIHSADAVYEQSIGKIVLTGGADISQGTDYIKGDTLTAQLFPNKKMQNAFARGNAYLKQVTPDRTTEVNANELTANFNENQQILNAKVNQNANVSIVPAQSPEYSKVTISSPKSINLTFNATANDSFLSQLQTDGRTTINMTAPPNNPNSTNRKLTADNVQTVLRPNGKDLQKANAIGNAELYVEPLRAAPDKYKTTVTAARFDCDFFETGNNAKICVANSKAKAVMQPTVANRDVRTLTANILTANFDQKTQDVERFEANGNAKFTEADRNGLASQMIYTAADEMVKLRGGEPTVFDSRARAKAGEIDWDTKNSKSFLRNKVSTTYYSQKQTNGATPFTRTNAPVYVTGENAQFDHLREVGIYSGNARAWQENNFVRADELVLYQKESRFEGSGKVQSLLYNAKRKEGGKTSNQPVNVSSDKIAYNDSKKYLRYENKVDIRQGTDRILSGVADIYLDEKNEMKQTIVENDVTITQPNRRVRGTWAQYTAADEIVILRGNPATVEDSIQGTTQGNQLTVAMRENRIVNEGSTKQGGTGRTRTVYKVKNQ